MDFYKTISEYIVNLFDLLFHCGLQKSQWTFYLKGSKMFFSNLNFELEGFVVINI